MMRIQLLIILFISSLFIQSCVSVPPLILSKNAEAEFIGRSYDSLVETYGLATNKDYNDDGSYIASWEMGVAENRLTGFYPALGFSLGKKKQMRLVTYMSNDNLVYRVQAIGYKLGNENEVFNAMRANLALGGIVVGVTSVVIILILFLSTY